MPIYLAAAKKQNNAHKKNGKPSRRKKPKTRYQKTRPLLRSLLCNLLVKIRKRINRLGRNGQSKHRCTAPRYVAMASPVLQIPRSCRQSRKNSVKFALIAAAKSSDMTKPHFPCPPRRCAHLYAQRNPDADRSFRDRHIRRGPAPEAQNLYRPADTPGGHSADTEAKRPLTA